MRPLLSAVALALVCAAILGIEQTIGYILRRAVGEVSGLGTATTLLTLAAVVAGAWALDVLRRGDAGA